MAFTIITGGSFTSTGANVKIPLPSSADYFRTSNMTQLAASNPNTVVYGQYFGPSFGAGASAAGLGIQTVKTTAMLDSNFGANLGFTYVTTTPIVEAQAAAAITSITAANPAVVTQTNTYNNGDIIRIYNTGTSLAPGMQNIGGMTFQVSGSGSGTGYTLAGLPATVSNGFAQAATTGNTRRVSTNQAVDPEFLYITNISVATQAVVSLSVDPSLYYVVGNKVHFSVPSSYGMTQINQLTGTILAVNAVSATGNIGAYNVTVDTNSSAFTAFAFPLASLTPTAQAFATMAPAGSSTTFNPTTNVQTGYEFVKTPFHTGQFTPYMLLVGGAQSPAGAASDIINWQAFKQENT